MDELYKEINEQEKILRSMRSLYGYTRSSVQKAIDEITEDYNSSDEPNDLQKMLLQRANEMQSDLDILEEYMNAF